ncbi:MAG: HAD family hydrolase [Microcoleus sp.]
MLKKYNLDGKRKMSQYKLIIFDFDGTLAITHNAIISCITKTFEKFLLVPPNADLIRSTIGVNLAKTFQILHPAIETTEIPLWVETYRYYYRTEGEKQLALFSGTKEILQLAKEVELSLGVVSNKHVLLSLTILKKFLQSLYSFSYRLIFVCLWVFFP